LIIAGFAISRKSALLTKLKVLLLNCTAGFLYFEVFFLQKMFASYSHLFWGKWCFACW